MPRRPNTPAQPERSPDQGRALLLRNLPPEMHRHIRRAAADADSSLEGYVKRLIELDMAKASPGPATGYQYIFHTHTTDHQRADALLLAFVATAERLEYQISGGMVKVDDNGNPTD